MRRRILGEKRGSFPRRGSNWLATPDPASDAAWRQDVALLAETHRRLRAAVAGLSPRHLDRTPPGSRVSTRALAAGVAMHDVYHAGQIQLLKRLEWTGSAGADRASAPRRGKHA